jgi:DnaJ like chaperone protein
MEYEMSFWERIATAAEDARRKTLGGVLDALAERRARRDEADFAMALIALSAKIARADGAADDAEFAAFGRFFDAPAGEATRVRMIYDLAKQDVAGFDHYVSRVARLYQDERAVLEDVLDCLFHVAASDGVAHPRELAMLEQASKSFGIDDAAFRRLKAAHLGHDHDDPWIAFGLQPGASLADVRERYRALMKEHHPDALIARGVPANLVRIAEARAAALNHAFETILAGEKP